MFILRYKGRINRPESKFSGTRKLELGTKSFSGFKRPESLLQTTQAPATVKPQGLSLSSRNKNLPGLKPLETKTAIKPSVGNRFSLSSGPRKMTSFSQVASIGIEKSKFVNGGQRNPDVKVEGNLSKGPGFSFLPGLSGGASSSGKPIETKKFIPSSGRSGTTKLDNTAQKRYGAFDAAASAPSAYQAPPASSSSRGPGGFGASFASSFNDPLPPQEPPAQQQQQPYQPSYETQPFSPSRSSSAPSSSAPALPSFGGAPSFQQAPSFAARTGQNAYSSAPGYSPAAPASSGFDRFNSFNSQQAVPQLAAPLATQAPAKQNLPVWNGGGGFSIPPPPSANNAMQSVFVLISF